MTLIDRIKKIAKAHGYTLLQLNKKAKLGKNVIYSWKNKTPSIENLQKVADVLGVTVNDLLGKEDKKKTTADLSDEDVIFTYEGRQIPPEDIELMKRLLRGTLRDKKE